MRSTVSRAARRDTPSSRRSRLSDWPPQQPRAGSPDTGSRRRSSASAGARSPRGTSTTPTGRSRTPCRSVRRRGGAWSLVRQMNTPAGLSSLSSRFRPALAGRVRRGPPRRCGIPCGRERQSAAVRKRLSSSPSHQSRRAAVVRRHGDGRPSSGIEGWRVLRQPRARAPRRPEQARSGGPADGVAQRHSSGAPRARLRARSACGPRSCHRRSRCPSSR